jgi:hypothetical protein
VRLSRFTLLVCCLKTAAAETVLLSFGCGVVKGIVDVVRGESRGLTPRVDVSLGFWDVPAPVREEEGARVNMRKERSTTC